MTNRLNPRTGLQEVTFKRLAWGTLLATLAGTFGCSVGPETDLWGTGSSTESTEAQATQSAWTDPASPPLARLTRSVPDDSVGAGERKREWRTRRTLRDTDSVGAVSDAATLPDGGLVSLSPYAGLDPARLSFAMAAAYQGAEPSEVEQLRKRVEELERRVGGNGEGKSGEAAASSDPDSEEGASGDDDATGTDPRSFGTKFMPYYRFTELKNGLYTNELTLFGLVRLSDYVALTYELPVAKNAEYGSVREFKNGQGLQAGQGGGTSAGGVPPVDLDSDGDSVGVGDSIFRVMFKNDHLRWENPIGPGQLEILPGFQTTVPTATNTVIGGEAWTGAPFFALVVDMPANGFLALMNFYEFDIFRDGGREPIDRFIGRWFYMQPLTPPQYMAKDDPDIPDLGPWLAGYYLLPEVQPIYDFEIDDFSFWVGPEFGKMLAEGRVVYLKPGFGIDQERAHRKFTLELGFRWFF